MVIFEAFFSGEFFAACSNLVDTSGRVKVRTRQRFWHPYVSVIPSTIAADNERLVNLNVNGLSAMVGEQLDLTDDRSETDGPSGKMPTSGRRFVGVQFRCCDVYSRVYINRDETAYEGNCPKCAKRVRLTIGPGGTDARFFTAG
jgi:hypothetical protein